MGVDRLGFFTSSCLLIGSSTVVEAGCTLLHPRFSRLDASMETVDERIIDALSMQDVAEDDKPESLPLDRVPADMISMDTDPPDLAPFVDAADTFVDASADTAEVVDAGCSACAHGFFPDSQKACKRS